MSFSETKTTFMVDSFKENAIVIEVGQVWRMGVDAFHGEVFSDCVVIGIEVLNIIDKNVRLSRPYVYASGTGTTGPVPLVGNEVFEVQAKNLVKDFECRRIKPDFVVHP